MTTTKVYCNTFRCSEACSTECKKMRFEIRPYFPFKGQATWRCLDGGVCYVLKEDWASSVNLKKTSVLALRSFWEIHEKV